MKEYIHPPLKNNVARWLIISAVLLLIFIVWLVFIDGNITPDEKVFGLVGPHITPGRTQFMKAVAFLGNHKFLIPANLLLIAVLLLCKYKWGAITAASVALSSVGMMSLLKNLVQRQRPSNQLVEGITNFSFPSGHAFMSIAFYGFLIWWSASTIKNKIQQRLLISFLLFLILIIGFSRIYLRVHYTTDVFAGFCIGIIWLFFCLWLTDKFKPASGFVSKH
ncbi:MAG: phosphatase PAP2 family protein [Chitinophagaceae bacterium]